jgi:hypothetical protein
MSIFRKLGRSIGHAFKKTGSEVGGLFKKSAHSIAKGVGAVVGGLGGAEVGGAIGALIGPEGVPIGAAIGSVVGKAVGEQAGSRVHDVGKPTRISPVGGVVQGIPQFEGRGTGKTGMRPGHPSVPKLPGPRPRLGQDGHGQRQTNSIEKARPLEKQSMFVE